MGSPLPGRPNAAIRSPRPLPPSAATQANSGTIYPAGIRTQAYPAPGKVGGRVAAEPLQVHGDNSRAPRTMKDMEEDLVAGILHGRRGLKVFGLTGYPALHWV